LIISITVYASITKSGIEVKTQEKREGGFKKILLALPFTKGDNVIFCKIVCLNSMVCPRLKKGDIRRIL
jgi:hypothetical protein